MNSWVKILRGVMFMGRTSKISPLGLYNWDDTIFDLFVIPEELERDTLIDNLLMETAELEVVYPNPTVFKNLLGIWSHRQLEIWQRLYATTQYEYNLSKTIIDMKQAVKMEKEQLYIVEQIRELLIKTEVDQTPIPEKRNKETGLQDLTQQHLVMMMVL